MSAFVFISLAEWDRGIIFSGCGKVKLYVESFAINQGENK